MVLIWAALMKVSREILVNEGRLAPMMVSLCMLFTGVLLCLGYYAHRLGYVDSSWMLVWYISTLITMVIAGIAASRLLLPRVQAIRERIIQADRDKRR